MSGESLAELISAIQIHVVDHHGYTEEQANSPQKIAEWRGAITSSSRPSDIRTNRGDV
ncbi:MAG: hypothetical protein IIB28_02115 [Chloroflexi bacterium]|nr:hypothetical protein [Chloroflexota bacterium]